MHFLLDRDWRAHLRLPDDDFDDARMRLQFPDWRLRRILSAWAAVFVFRQANVQLRYYDYYDDNHDYDHHFKVQL